VKTHICNKAKECEHEECDHFDPHVPGFGDCHKWGDCKQVSCKVRCVKVKKEGAK
jgi:hypothetical protein